MRFHGMCIDRRCNGPMSHLYDDFTFETFGLFRQLDGALIHHLFNLPAKGAVQPGNRVPDFLGDLFGQLITRNSRFVFNSVTPEILGLGHEKVMPGPGQKNHGISPMALFYTVLVENSTISRKSSCSLMALSGVRKLFFACRTEPPSVFAPAKTAAP